MKKNIELLLQNSFFKAGILLTISNFISGGFNYLFNIISGRSLGPVGYGEITTLFSYLIIATFPVGVIHTLVVQKMGHKDDPEEFSYSLQKWINKLYQKWWFIVLVPILISPLLPRITNLSEWTSYALIFMIYASVLSGWYDSILQGRHLFWAYVILAIVLSLFKLTGSLSALYLQWGIIGILIFLCIGMMVKIICSHLLLFNKASISKNTQIIQKRFISIFKEKQFWLSLLFGASIITISNIDMIYVKKMFTAEEAGLYGAWSLYAKIITYICGPLLSIAFIYFSNRKQHKHHDLVLSLSVISLILMSIGIFIVFDSYRRLLIDSIFGKKYLQLLPYMDWAGIFGAMYLFLHFFMNYYLAKGSNRTLILPLFIPIYIVSILLFGKNIPDVMIINVLFCSAVTVFFLLDYFILRIKKNLLS